MEDGEMVADADGDRTFKVKIKRKSMKILTGEMKNKLTKTGGLFGAIFGVGDGW